MRLFNKIKLYITILIILLIYNTNTLASIDQSEIDVRGKMIFDRYYNDVIIYIQSNDVKMTQDNDYYYFDISQDLINYTTFNGNYELNLVPTMIVSNMTDLSSLRIRTEEAVHTYERVEKVYYGFYGSDGSRNQVAHYNMDYHGTVRKNTNSVNYYIADDYSVYNNPNANKISLTVTGSATAGNTFNIKTKFSIKKDSIEGLRYFSFLFDKVYSKLGANGALTGNVKCGVTNYVIDLMQYTDCEHEFELRECDDEKHSIYCNKCEWLINDYHDFSIDYDYIENDECICGLRKQVRLTHKNNLNNLVIQKLATPNDIIEYEKDYDYIKGHTLLYYEDEELIDNNWDLATKSIVATMPNAVPINSHNYTAVYKVNSYYINYSNVNNLNLDFDFQMDAVKLDYGEKYNLDENLYKRVGYNFLGWAIRPDITKEVFSDKEEIESLTDIDDAIVTLHPVFSPYTYTIHYIDYRYGKNYYKIYTYDNNLALDINYDLQPTDTFEGFKINGETLHISNTKDLLQYILKDNEILTLEVQYYVDYNEHDIVYNNEIKIITESNEYKTEFNNELPIAVEFSVDDRLKDKKINNDDAFNDYDFDKGIVDIFLSANIRKNGQKAINHISNSNWMKDINRFILKIKEILDKNELLALIVRIFMMLSVCFLIFMLILLIIYIVYRVVNDRHIFITKT